MDLKNPFDPYKTIMLAFKKTGEVEKLIYYLNILVNGMSLICNNKEVEVIINSLKESYWLDPLY